MTNKIKKYCTTCGSVFNRNYIEKPCPECGATYGDIKKEEDIKKLSLTEEEKVVLTSYGVPKHFQGIVWDKEVLMKSHPNYKENFMLNKYITLLDNFNQVFIRGAIPQSSVIIISPERFGKQITAFSCMQLAKKNGYTVAPYLNTAELKAKFSLASERADIKAIQEIEDIVNADVCFVYITHLYTRKNAFETISELVTRRANRDKVTFITSHYNIRECTEWDIRGRYHGILDDAYSENTYEKRYLSKIECARGGNVDV